VLIAICALVVIATSSAGTTSKAGSKPIVVGYTPPPVTISDFYVNMARGFQTEAAKIGLNATVLLKAPSSHAASAEQLNIVQSFINRHVDYLWISPVAYEAGAPMFAAADRAHIPVVAGPFLTNYPGSKILSYVGFSEFDNAANQAKWAIASYGTHLKVAITQGAPGQFNSDRVNGLMSVLKNYPSIKIVAKPVCNWDRQQALDAVSNIITATPDLNVVFTVASDMGLGAIEALKTAGKLNKPTHVVGFDASGAEINSMLRGEESASMFDNPIGIGALVADTILAHLNHKQVPHLQKVKLIAVTKANAKSIVPGWYYGIGKPKYFPQYAG
jgi:ABC-type sugar transport system substrate-binding protein